MTQKEERAFIKETLKDGVLVIKLSGRLDAMTTPGVEKKIFEHINSGYLKVLIDFGDLDYLSSAGVRMLLSMTKKLKNQGKLCLCSVNEGVFDVLHMSGFDQLLDIERNEEMALRRF